MLQFTYFMDAEGKGKISNQATTRWLPPRLTVSVSRNKHQPGKKEVGICNGRLGPLGITYRWRLLIVKIIHTISVFYLHRVIVVVVVVYNHGENPQFIDFPQFPTPFTRARFLILPQQKKIFQSSEHPLVGRWSSSSHRHTVVVVETRQSRKRSIDQILISLPLFGCPTPPSLREGSGSTDLKRWKNQTTRRWWLQWIEISIISGRGGLYHCHLQITQKARVESRNV